MLNELGERKKVTVMWQQVFDSIEVVNEVLPSLNKFVSVFWTLDHVS